MTPPKTSKAEATKRPWKQEAQNRGNVAIVRPTEYGNDPLIAEMYDSDYVDLPEQEANAALIVQSVNEYDALCAVAEAADKLSSNGAATASERARQYLDLRYAIDALAALRSKEQ